MASYNTLMRGRLILQCLATPHQTLDDSFLAVEYLRHRLRKRSIWSHRQKFCQICCGHVRNRACHGFLPCFRYVVIAAGQGTVNLALLNRLNYCSQTRGVSLLFLQCGFSFVQCGFIFCKAINHSLSVANASAHFAYSIKATMHHSATGAFLR